MFYILIWFAFNFNVIEATNDTSLLIPNNNNDLELVPVAECIKTISNMELKFQPTVAINTWDMKNKTKEIIMEKIINKIMRNKIVTVITNNTVNNIQLIKAVGPTNNVVQALVIIFIEMCEELAEINIKREIKYLIIILDTSSGQCFEALLDIKKIVDKYDVTFMLADDFGIKSEIFTFVPEINEETCQLISDKPIHISTCFNGTLQNNKVFPLKNPINLNKCPLNIGMSTLYPFSEIKNKESLQTYDRINNSKGLDIELLKIAVKYFNASLHLYFILRREGNPYVQNEFLKYVLNGSLDVCAGGLYRIYGNIVAYSGIYARQAVNWIYTVERSERSWENLIRKLNGQYIFIIIYICYSIIWYLIRIFDGNATTLNNTFLYSWGALVGARSLGEAKSLKEKFLNLGYSVICIHFSAYISIQLYSFLTIREPPNMFITNDDIMNSGRIPFLRPRAKYFVKDAKYIDFANTSEDCESFIDCSEKALKYNGLTVILQGDFYNFQSTTAVNGEARILRAAENILTVYNEMIIRKDSPVAGKFKTLIQSLFEAGITEKLYSEAIGILMIAKANRANSNIMMDSYSCRAGCMITLKQFAGVFYVWIFGCLISCIVFIFEMYLKRK